jgi:ammonium transporter, Amt family
MQELTLALALTLLLRIGHFFWLGGSVRSKNAASMAVRLLLDFAVVSLAVWATGGAFLADTRIFDAGHLFGMGAAGAASVMIVPFALLATGAMHGAIAERSRLAPPLVIAGVLGGVVLPLLLQLLSRIDTRFRIDDNRGVAVALSAAVGGAVALMGALLLTGRKGKFNRDLSVNFVPSHNVPGQIAGVFVLGVGLIVNIGNAANGVLGLSAAALAAAAFGRLRFGKIDTNLVLAGTIGGILATAGGVQTLPTYAAVLAGALAGAIVPWVVMQLEVRLRIDDVAGTAASHLVGAVIGLLIGGLLRPGTMGDRMATLTGHLLLLSIALAASAILAGLVFGVFRRRNTLRVTESAEFDGGDLAELDLNAYPDFQQTMIKSHHLREL